MIGEMFGWMFCPSLQCGIKYYKGHEMITSVKFREIGQMLSSVTLARKSIHSVLGVSDESFSSLIFHAHIRQSVCLLVCVCMC